MCEAQEHTNFYLLYLSVWMHTQQHSDKKMFFLLFCSVRFDRDVCNQLSFSHFTTPRKYDTACSGSSMQEHERRGSAESMWNEFSEPGLRLHLPSPWQPLIAAGEIQLIDLSSFVGFVTHTHKHKGLRPFPHVYWHFFQNYIFLLSFLKQISVNHIFILQSTGYDN